MDECTANVAGLFNLRQIISFSPVTSKELAKETGKDSLLSQVMKFVVNGWPTCMTKSDPLYSSCCSKQAHMTSESGCFLWAMRMVVSKSLSGKGP